MVILYLTCANEDEAKTISRALLEARLIACARRSPVSSSYWWDGKINQDIEKVVTKLHSYDEYVLTAVPVLKTTPGVRQWLNETLNPAA